MDDRREGGQEHKSFGRITPHPEIVLIQPIWVWGEFSQITNFHVKN